MTQSDLDRICVGAKTKSEKIRLLAKAGVGRGDIARYLGVRYQFVYNVIKAADQNRANDGADQPQFMRPADDEPLTIAEAKRRLALSFGVDPSAIRITVEG